MLSGTKHSGQHGTGEQGGSAGTTPTPGKPLTPEQLDALWQELCYSNGECRIRDSGTLNPFIMPTEGGDGTDAVAGDPARAVTITDLARFLPAAAALHAEPNGWAVVDVPANFWVDVSPVTVDGELFDELAQVRFTPRGYRFDYGDGTSRTATTPGASWAALGQQELTETATSHRYTARADRRATVTVFYSAEYRVAGGAWTGISGAVAGTTPPVRELVVVERTALTAPTSG